MTTAQSETISFKTFTNSVLPWIVSGCAFVLYLLTLNHFVTLSSLPVFAKVIGWDWQKPVAAPLYFLVTLPIKWLPASWQIIGLNVLSAVFGALTLALLARSITLLPQDRTKEQRMREHDEFSLLSIRWAWIPPVAAVLLCGLQLSFWENATVASGEMLDLLLFAYVIRCLLEYRLTERESWLTKFAFVYGVGMANNWAMVGYFPAFLAALVWIRGFSFFNARFIGKIALFWGAGLLFYLLLPAVVAASGNGVSFWEALRTNLGNQKNLTLNNPFIGGLKFDFLTMALTSLIPMLLVCIRWTADYADVSPVGTKLTNYMFRIVHLALLVFCVWVFFDYKFSPRILGRGFIPFLTFYYLSAICVGYFCGYVLLVFGREGERVWGRSRSPLRKLNKALAFATGVAVLCAPLWLFYRSFTPMRQINGPAVKEFATLMAKTLPNNAVLLSDDVSRPYLMQALNFDRGAVADQIFLNTRLLASGLYQSHLKKAYPAAKDLFFDVKTSRDVFDTFSVIGLLDRIQQHRPLYYLHYSFGYYFERFYARQHGMVFELRPYVDDQLTVPPLSEKEIEDNEQFWNAISAPSLKALSLAADKIQDAAVLCTLYSSALNAWGVELQCNHQLKPAEEKFYVACYLDPNNVVAQLNGRYNVSLQHGDSQPVKADEALIKELNYLRGIVGAVAYFGPLDEPSARMVLGDVFDHGHNLRQAVQQFSRVVELLPEDATARLNLSRVLLQMRKPDLALKSIQPIENTTADYKLEFIDVRSRALLLKNDYVRAEELIMQMLEEQPTDETRNRLAYQFYVNAGDAVQEQQPEQARERYRKAVGILDQLYSLSPDTRYLFNKAVVLMGKLKEPAQAVSIFNRILEAEPGNGYALLNRAILHLQLGELDAARTDYLAVEKLSPAELPRVYYGLAEIAERKNNTAEVIKYLRDYLKVATPNTEEYNRVSKRLKQFQTGNKS